VRAPTAVMICSGLWLAGCSPSSSPPAADPPIPVAVRDEAPEKPVVDPTTPAEVTVSGFRLQVPAGWRQAELTSAQQGFVDARFEIPALGDDVKLTLSTISGGVEANLERWVGQVRLPDGATPITESFEVDGIPVRWIDLSGEFTGMQQEPQAGWRMLGAAFDGEPRDFYIKLTGPAAEIGQIEAEFRGFAKSVRLVRD
jgi:hypothetical protein